MTTQKYNGWTNYSTWRIALEWFDGLSCYDLTGYDLEEIESTSDLAELIQSYVEQYIENEDGSQLTKSYAMAFLDDVNWYEIAEHLAQEWKEESEAA